MLTNNSLALKRRNIKRKIKKMGQSLTKNFIHIVFSTKHRKPLIDDYIGTELYSYLGLPQKQQIN
jgi:hypothetical protein